MKIRVGFEMIYDCPQPTPMIFNLNVHFTRVSDLVGRDDLEVDPPVRMAAYRDSFGNWCTRIVAVKGRTRLGADALVNDSGAPDVIVPQAQQLAVPDLPEETLLFLLGSRYCETDRLSETAWNLFGKAPTGWGPRAGDLRLCASAYHLRLRTRAHDTHGAGSVSRQDRRLPRLCAPCRSFLPLHEYPRALLHRLSRRHRHAAAVRPDGFRRLVRGIPRRPLVHV